MPKRYNLIDLFCGCGGFSLGFFQAGFNVRLGVDIWADATKTYKHNIPNADILNEDIAVLTGDNLVKILGMNKEDVDIIIGGPPCQGNAEDFKTPKNMIITALS